MMDAQQAEKPEMEVAATREAAPAPGLIVAMQERTQSGLEQISDAARDAFSAFGEIAQSGATDRMRGYANETVGRAKIVLGLAARSPELTVAGLAQIAVGGVQRAIGEAKDEDETERAARE